MRIDRSDQADGPDPDDSDAAGKDRGKEVSIDRPADSSATCPNSALLTERSVAYRAKVDAVYQQYAIDHGYAPAGKLERETAIPAIRRIEAEDPERDQVGPGDRLEGKDLLAEAVDLTNKDMPVLVDNGWDRGDVPDDPRNYSNPKTGRFDASWSTYDRAIVAAREHAGRDFGPDSIRMYDYNPETGEGTGTLIGEQAPDRLRGWRIDGHDGHVNWWDWTAGKKGAGGVYGHDWFPEDASTPGSRYIGWAPWQDSDGNVLDGN